MFCSQCGTQVAEGANFCNKCGAKLSQTAAPASPAPTAAPPPVTPRPVSAASQAASIPSSTEAKGSSKGMLFGLAGVAVIVLAGAGVYFGTDLLREPAKSEPPPSTAAAPPKVMEAPRAAGSDAPKPPTELLSTQSGETAGSAPAASGGATPGTYQTTRPTTVYEAPSASAKVVANIDSGVPVNVVGSNGEFLEVRSKSGKPPGFIRSADATLTEPAK